MLRSLLKWAKFSLRGNGKNVMIIDGRKMRTMDVRFNIIHSCICWSVLGWSEVVINKIVKPFWVVNNYVGNFGNDG